MTRVSHVLDRIGATFDDPNLVANAGLLLVATVSQRLGLEDLIDATVRLDGRVGGARPGRKVLTLAHAMCAGSSHIDHADMLRTGTTESVLGHRVMAPSTIGTFLRSFTFGHCRQMEAVNGHALQRAWAAGVGPDAKPLVIDIDSTICEVDGDAEQGAGLGYTHVLGYHPILATRADTGEVLHARMRKGSANTLRGTGRFLNELIARVRRAGATGQLTVRVDSGFWSNDTIVALNRLDVRYTMAVRCGTKGIADAISTIPETAWTEIAYTADGQAQVADCAYTTGNGKRAVTRRLVVRRTRLTGRAQQRLVARLETPRVPHRPRRHTSRRRSVPTPSRRRRTRDPRPQTRRRARARPIRQLPRQQRLVAMRGPGVQPDPLDRDPRQHPCRQPADRRPHDPHSAPDDPRPARQPRRPTDPAAPDRLALGQAVHHCARHAPHTATRDRLTPDIAVRRAAQHHQRRQPQPHDTQLQRAPTATNTGSATTSPTWNRSDRDSRARSVDRGSGRA